MKGNARWTIDQLASLSGVSARNIREYQAQGLVAKPLLQGRTGYYGTKHLQRLECVQALQEDGLRLSDIKRILQSSGLEEPQALRCYAAGFRPFLTADIRLIPGGEAAAVLGQPTDSEAFQRCAALGAMRVTGDGDLEISDELWTIAGELRGLGLSFTEMADAAERVSEFLDALAEPALVLFEQVLTDLRLAKKDDASKLGELENLVGRLAPLAPRAALELFRITMDRRIPMLAAID